ncbi:unnamed protein product, partial [Ectocarpus sp. 12 AP-2014]
FPRARRKCNTSSFDRRVSCVSISVGYWASDIDSKLIHIGDTQYRYCRFPRRYMSIQMGIGIDIGIRCSMFWRSFVLGGGPFRSCRPPFDPLFSLRRLLLSPPTAVTNTHTPATSHTPHKQHLLTISFSYIPFSQGFLFCFLLAVGCLELILARGALLWAPNNLRVEVC